MYIPPFFEVAWWKGQTSRCSTAKEMCIHHISYRPNINNLANGRMPPHSVTPKEGTYTTATLTSDSLWKVPLFSKYPLQWIAKALWRPLQHPEKPVRRETWPVTVGRRFSSKADGWYIYICIYIYWWSWWYIDDFPMIQWNSMIILQTLSFRLDFLDQATKGYLRNREEIVILRRQFQHSNSATGGHNNPSQEPPNKIQQPGRLKVFHNLL